MSQDSLEAFEALFHDLESLRDLNRLSTELEAHIGSFRDLLKHPVKSQESRRLLQSEQTITINDIAYKVNDEFRNSVLQLADELDLDELQCAKLLFDAQVDANELDRSPIVSAIMRFHKRRQYLLECLRLAFYESIEGGDVDEQLGDEDSPSQDEDSHRLQTQSLLGNFTNLVLNQSAAPSPTPASYWQKCLNALQDIEEAMQKVANRMQRAAVVGQTLSEDEEQIMAFEKDSLAIQHESLASIMTFLVSQGRVSSLEDFVDILKRMKKLDKHDVTMLHYLPIAMAYAISFGSANSSCTESEARNLHNLITDHGDAEHWSLRSLCRAVRAWWIAEYRGRYSDDNDSEAASNTDVKLMLDCLRDGGLQFMLSIAQDVRRNEWHDPAKLQLTSFLLKGTAVLPSDTPRAAPHFQELLMEHFQSFVDAFISNMPDTLRQLKFDEDDQRKLLRSRFQNNTAEYTYDLDRFLTIIAYAYQDSPESAKSFWADTESNLYGFLQWAAKRQTTPRAAAFCEMLRSLSEGEQCADSAHAFLLEEGAPVTGKMRRIASLGWAQIFAELEFYASQTKDRQATISNQLEPQFEPGQSVEPESNVMLECYLRLTTHISAGSAKARSWLLSLESPPLPQLLFQLVSTSNDGRVRAWCLTTLAALLAGKTAAINDAMWERLDQWLNVSASNLSLTNRPPAVAMNPRSDRTFLDVLATGFEECNGFVHLMNALVVPVTSDQHLNDQLSFPENLGSPHRLPGVDTYVDFVLGNAFADKTTKLSDEHHLNLMRLNCLDFICIVLKSFNEDLVIIANLSNDAADGSLRASSLDNYVSLHPFARVMEWLHEDQCLEALFAAANRDVSAVNHALTDSPLVLSLVRALEAMNLMLKMQAMYFDIVKPFVKRRTMHEKPVTRSPVPSLEDGFLKHLNLIVKLGLYCGLGHSELTLASLALLERLSSSRKLSGPPGRDSDPGDQRNRLIAVLKKDNEVLRISRALTTALSIDTREIETGPLSSGYSIKAGVLRFLGNTIKSSPNKHNVAYLLLGFSYQSNALIIEDVDGFQTGHCLFYSIARLSIDYPDSDGVSFISWASNIKEAAGDIMKLLWQAPLTNSLVLSQLRESDFGFMKAMQQSIIGTQTMWDGRTLEDPAFMLTESAIGLRNFLRQRSAAFDFFARELRYAKASGAGSYLHRLQQALLGTVSMPGESRVTIPNLFELFDFMELDLTSFHPVFPENEIFDDAEFEICVLEKTAYGPVYDVPRAEEIVLLRKNALLRSKSTSVYTKEIAKVDDQELAAFDNVAENVVCTILARNQWREVIAAHQEALRSWIRLMTVMVQECDFDSNVRIAFFQQAYQLLVPKFERSLTFASTTGFELASLFLVLFNASELSKVSPISGSSNKDVLPRSIDSNIRSTNRLAEYANDLEFQVFRAALTATTSSNSSLDFRGLCYQICNLYLRAVSSCTSAGSNIRRNILRSVKVVQDRLLEAICDDAYTSHDTNGIAPLLLLEALVVISAADAPKLLLESLDRLNFIAILVDSIRQIPTNLQQAVAAEIPGVLDYHAACLALLVRISQTRAGAVAVFNAGLLPAIGDSNIFSLDPDVGFEMDDVAALKNFYVLMLAVARIINMVVIQHQSQQTLAATRQFIAEHRNSLIGILKRFAAVGGLEVHQSIDLADLVDNITVLISASAFLEV